MHIAVDKELYNYCFETVRRKRCTRGKNDTTSGGFYHQFCGLVAENIVRRLFGMEANKDYTAFDGGWDIEYEGYRTDVKTTIYDEYPQPYHEYHVSEKQKHLDCDAYIFCNYNTTNDVVSVCGFIEKHSFFDIAKKVRKGTLIQKPNRPKKPARYTSYYVNYEDLLEIDFKVK